MATSTFALDSANTHRFLGFGTHTPLYEKGFPLTNNGCDLTEEAYGDLLDDLSLYSWMRIHGIGGEHFQEDPSREYSYPTYRQAARLAQLNRDAGPFRYILSPYATPSKTIVEGANRVWRMLGTYDVTLWRAQAAFTSSTGNWQTTTDAFARALDQFGNAGCGIEWLSPPNEQGTDFVNVPIWWLSYMTSAQTLDFVKKVWLGDGTVTTPLKDQYPHLKFCYDYASSQLDTDQYRSEALADATVAAAVDYYGRHDYTKDVTLNTTTGIYDVLTDGASKWAITEFGMFVDKDSGYDDADAAVLANIITRDIVYFRTPIMVQWTCVRDSVVKRTADFRGAKYTAQPTHQLTTSTGTFVRLPFWWVVKAHLIACGKGEATVWRAASGSSDANFIPATDVYVNVYHRTGDGSAGDGKYGIVYANFSGSATTDTLSFTSGGNPANLSGRRKTIDVSAGTEGAWSDISTTAGSYALGSVASGDIVVLEFS